jgi:hypothetical protein
MFIAIMLLHVMMCAFRFLFVNRSHSEFKFDLNSK